jgi:hypothetical protein
MTSIEDYFLQVHIDELNIHYVVQLIIDHRMVILSIFIQELFLKFDFHLDLNKIENLISYSYLS